MALTKRQRHVVKKFVTDLDLGGYVVGCDAEFAAFAFHFFLLMTLLFPWWVLCPSFLAQTCTSLLRALTVDALFLTSNLLLDAFVRSDR
ncbi:hypothetical protein BDV96DRAFT_575274 [Lophiotrema nucula]|uniref:Uncharacterized protein n=1 Tax=Lophiotrema nucula TaxID=690887 RepID=A0A6A5Z8N7_9PLEO|nr:hypothetical protein BDV96DRAFT_575274 [Lophiotrema nucula]